MTKSEKDGGRWYAVAMGAEEKDYSNGRCCVFQPFDQGVFDRRYEEILVPAIEAAKMERTE